MHTRAIDMSQKSGVSHHRSIAIRTGFDEQEILDFSAERRPVVESIYPAFSSLPPYGVFIGRHPLLVCLISFRYDADVNVA